MALKKLKTHKQAAAVNTRSIILIIPETFEMIKETVSAV
jgi:hypothetical protein